eukprot:gene7531-biopygen21054
MRIPQRNKRFVCCGHYRALCIVACTCPRPAGAADAARGHQKVSPVREARVVAVTRGKRLGTRPGRACFFKFYRVGRFRGASVAVSPRGSWNHGMATDGTVRWRTALMHSVPVKQCRHEKIFSSVMDCPWNPHPGGWDPHHGDRDPTPAVGTHTPAVGTHPGGRDTPRPVPLGWVRACGGVKVTALPVGWTPASSLDPLVE